MYIREHFKKKTMSTRKVLSDLIKKNPYLKLSNCVDLSDINCAIDELRRLDSEFGKENPTLLRLWSKFLDKKNKFEFHLCKSKI